jgi:hypothetical protein
MAEIDSLKPFRSMVRDNEINDNAIHVDLDSVKELVSKAVNDAELRGAEAVERAVENAYKTNCTNVYDSMLNDATAAVQLIRDRK